MHFYILFIKVKKKKNQLYFEFLYKKNEKKKTLWVIFFMVLWFAIIFPFSQIWKKDLRHVWDVGVNLIF